jgi:16S rRNA (guanine1516-N2)-methyltransferase
MSVPPRADPSQRTRYPAPKVVVCLAPARAAEAEALATRLTLPRAETVPRQGGRVALVFTDERLEARLTGANAPGPVYADFVAGATARRARQASEGLLRAAGARQATTAEVIDATAGLGGDAWLLAAVGCRVHLIERHPAVAALLADGLDRARRAPATAAIADRLTLTRAEAQAVLAATTADTVTLDPMHPPRRKSAAVRKEMQLLQALVGADTDNAHLLPAARAAARERVVVKRPLRGPALAGPAPSGRIAGRATRFDIYAGQAGRGGEPTSR